MSLIGSRSDADLNYNSGRPGEKVG